MSAARRRLSIAHPVRRAPARSSIPRRSFALSGGRLRARRAGATMGAWRSGARRSSTWGRTRSGLSSSRPRDGWWKRTDEIYEAVRIGEGLAATGELGEAGISRALAAIEVFAHFCAAAGSARRGRCRGHERHPRRGQPSRVPRARRAATGLTARVLSQEEEARYGYLAAVNSTTLSDGVVLDLGGGCMQLVRVAGRDARELGLAAGGRAHDGALRARRGPAKRKQLQALRDHVEAELETAPWLRRAGDRSSGSAARSAPSRRWRSAPRAARVRRQGFVITRESLGELIGRLAKLPPADRGACPASSRRAPT